MLPPLVASLQTVAQAGAQAAQEFRSRSSRTVSGALSAPIRHWIVNEQLEPSDAIVVLGGDSICGARIRRACELFKSGLASMLVLSGPPLRLNLNEGDVFARQAAALGIPPENIRVVQHDACYTLKEAEILCRFLDIQHLNKVILVTSDYHTRRTRWIFRKVSKRFGITTRVAAAPDSALNLFRWWQPRSGLVLLLSELLKTLYSSWELLKQAGSQPQAPSRLSR